MEQRLFDLLARDGVWLLFAAQMFGISVCPFPTSSCGRSLAASCVAAISPDCRRSGRRWPVAGMTFNYMIGRLGAHVLARLPAVGCATLSRAQSWLKRWGKWLLVFGCFVPGLRHVTPLAAGSAQLDFRTFSAYGYAGAALWSTTFIAIGYYAGAGHDWTHASFLLRGHHVLVAIALGGVLAFTSEAALGDGSRTRDASADLQRLDTRAADRRERQCAHLRAPWPLAHA